MTYLKIRCKDFCVNPLEWGSCLLNVIMCLCMAYFYYDSEQYAPLFYASFFVAYILSVFFVGEKIIPFLYLLYILGATQNITFINCTGFFIVAFLALHFPKQKHLLYIIYALEIFLVCFRHDKSVWHLLCHFSFCVTFYLLAIITKRKIEKNAIQTKADEIKSEVQRQIENDVKNQIRNEIKQNLKPLDLTENEENVIRQLAEGKMLKEIEDVSKNTKTDYIKSALKKNGFKSKDELIAMYTIRQKLPVLFPTIFQE